ncbi:conserved membrane protein of unknown function [Nitrospira japonica]|uniref:O-antigen ligase-related domain-containing protein n=1 Tax=Nitrospira japonica TaxID=1325564 RepID=A0A1W1I0B6_9BACT|nr:O-antigen ligase family protein [Nitrospira japonica]SLM46431.1 conserved membrane protein of unknown function [Nitrospira japonica]
MLNSVADTERQSPSAVKPAQERDDILTAASSALFRKPGGSEKLGIVASGGAILVGLLIFSPLLDGGTTHIPILVIRLALLMCLTIWLFRLARGGEAVVIQNVLCILVLIFVGYAGLTLWWTPYKNVGVQWLVTLLMYTVLFGAVIQTIRSTIEIRTLVLVIAGMGILESAWGLCQYFLLGESRAKGTFFNPNFFGTYEACMVGLACGVLCCVPHKELRRWEKAGFWMLLVMASCGFVVAQSRGAVLALGAVLAFVGLYRFRIRAIAVLLCGLIASMAIPNPLKQRFVDVSTQDPYAYSRIDIWKSSLERILDRPMGFGLGMYKYTSFQYRFPVSREIARYGKRAESAHNEYIQIAVELGMGGVSLFIVGIFVWSMKVRDTLRICKSSLHCGFVVGLASVTIAILAHAAVDSVFHEPALVILMIIAGGTVLSAWNAVTTRPTWELRLPRGIHSTGLVFGLTALLGVLIVQPAAGWYAHEAGEQWLRDGKTAEALTQIRLATFIDPGTSAYHDTIARIAAHQHHLTGELYWLEEAIEEERLAMVLNPLDARFPFRLGLLYVSRAGLSASDRERVEWTTLASESQERAIGQDPFAPQAYLELAKILVSQSHFDEARDLLERALVYEPNFLPARVVRGELLLRNGERAKAEAEYRAINEILQVYEGRTLTGEERAYIQVDARPLARALKG